MEKEWQVCLVVAQVDPVPACVTILQNLASGHIPSKAFVVALLRPQ